MLVFGTLTTQISIEVDAGTVEEALHKASVKINSYNLDTGIITLLDDHGVGHSTKVHDVEVEWESALSKESA